jgi:hypothetical protein
MTIFFVGRRRSDAFTGYGVGVTTQENAFYLLGTDNNWGAFTAGVNHSSGELMGTISRVFTVKRENEATNNVRLRANGAVKVISSGNTASGRVTSDIGSAAGVQPLNLDLHELIIYNRSLSDAEVTLVENLLNKKWKFFSEKIINAPTQLSGCIVWLDGMDRGSITTNATGSVSQWNDKSGLSNHATQSDNTRRPEYRATAFGGLPCVDYNSGSVTARNLATPNISLSAFTTFTVVIGTSGFVWAHNADTVNGAWCFSQNNDSIRCVRGGSYSVKNVGPNPATWIADGARKVVAVRFGGNWDSFIARTNGSNPGASESVAGVSKVDPGLTTVTGPFYLGNRAALITSLAGLIAEHIVFGRALSDAETSLVESYLARKWNI